MRQGSCSRRAGGDPAPRSAAIRSCRIGNQVDNSVFVVESGKTRKVMAKAAMKRLQQAGVNPLGVILTKIDAYHDLYGYHSRVALAGGVSGYAERYWSTVKP